MESGRRPAVVDPTKSDEFLPLIDTVWTKHLFCVSPRTIRDSFRRDAEHTLHIYVASFVSPRMTEDAACTVTLH